MAYIIEAACYLAAYSPVILALAGLGILWAER